MYLLFHFVFSTQEKIISSFLMTKSGENNVLKIYDKDICVFVVSSIFDQML